MRISGSILLAALVQLAPLQAWGQSANPITVVEAVRLALERNPRIAAADAEAGGARAAQREARAAGLPSLRTQVSYTRLGGDIPEAEVTLPGLDTTFTLIPFELNRYNTEFVVEQPVFTGGRIRGQARAAEHEAEAAGHAARQARIDIALAVRRAFWNLWSAVRQLEAAEAAADYIVAHVQVVANRFEAGEVLSSELRSAEARRSEIFLERLDAQNAVRAARLELAQLIGVPLDTPLVPEGDVQLASTPPEPVIPSPDELPTSPEIAGLTERVAALGARLGAVRATWAPEVGIVGRYVYARPNPYAFTEQSDFRGTWEAGVALSWSPWEGGARSARVSRAREELRAVEAQLRETRELAAIRLARQSLELRRAYDAVSVATEYAAQAAQALEETTNQFELGAVLSAQVLEAEQVVRAAEARRARALADYAIAEAALLHARGEM